MGRSMAVAMIPPKSAPDFLARHGWADAQILPPQIDVYGNADATPYPAEAAQIRRRLGSQLLTPVRFADQIEAMYEAGVRTFIEVGAGSVLTGLVGAGV